LEIQPITKGISINKKITPLGMVMDQAIDCHRLFTSINTSDHVTVMFVPSSTTERRAMHPPTNDQIAMIPIMEATA
jgi:hypothetical protein